MIKFAILSDLHIDIKNSSKLEKVLEKIINFFESMISEGNWVDYVLVTGDITANGDPGEFDIALNFFRRLEASLDIPSSNFIFVNGNHDYSRKNLDCVFKYLKKPNLEVYQEIFESEAFNSHLNESFKNFNSFLKRFLGKVPPLRGHRLDFNIPKIKESDLSIFLMHHPISYFYIDNRHQLDSLLTEYCDILISGHEHLPDYSVKRDVKGNEYISIINGSTFLNEQDKNYNRFSILEFEINKNQLKIIPYFTLPRMDFCAIDTSLYSCAKEDGFIFLYLKGISYEEIENELSDPLESFKIPEEISDFFQKKFNDIMNINDKKQLINLRKKIKSTKHYTLNLLSFYFLKYYLLKNLITNYEQLRSILNDFFIFSLIQNRHNEILQYYNNNYFENLNKDLKKTLSIKHKDLGKSELRNKLQLAEEEIKSLKVKKSSILELYHERSIDLLPKLKRDEGIEITEHFEWYKLLGLLSDPFPSNDGLENIEEEFFEKIIYPTSTIEEFKSVLISENNKDLINKTIGVYGPFGSGKTTLFQYIDQLVTIYHHETIVIFISLEARSSLDEIRRKFFLKLNQKLKEIHLKEFKFSIPEVDIEEDCINILYSLSGKKKELFIFIEDIYKHSGRKDYIEEVIGFIKALQIYKKDFNSSGIKTSFFFSAISEIIEKIRNDHSISGSVDNFYKMASIDMDIALAMINGRLKAYAKDPQKPYRVSSEYLSRLKQIAKQNGTPIITFRDYIKILLDRFRRLEFTEDSITIESDDQIIITIQKDLEAKHTNINKSFNQLLERTKKDRIIFEQFISILDKMWNEEPIIEGESLFFKEKSHLIHLMQTDLIQKIRINSKLGWTISDDCREYFNKLHNQYGLFPSSIIPSVFFVREKIIIPENKYLIALDNIIKRGEDYGSDFLNSLKNAKDDYEKIENLSSSIDIVKDDLINDSIIKIIQNSFSNFIIALVIQCDTTISNFNVALRRYEQSWYEDLEVIHFAKILQEYDIKILHEKAEDLALLREYISTIRAIISKMKRFVQWDTVFSLKDKKIWKNDKKILNDIRRNIDSNNPVLARKKIFNLLRYKLTNLIYSISVLLYGYQKWKRALPEDVNEKMSIMIKKIHKSKKIEEKDLLLRFKVEELFEIINFQNRKTENKIQLLNKITSIGKKIIPKFAKRNIWTREILDLVELADTYYENLLSGHIESPWNSHDIQKLDQINTDVDFDSETSKIIFSNLPLVLDKTLRPFRYFGLRLNLRLIASWALKNIDKLEIKVIYEKEQIILKSRY
jgi:predicted phosphodiesterase/energy-coupling factor transporter ATP-binding protein EcfA2